MERFTMDNTEGYSQEMLDALNAMFTDQVEADTDETTDMDDIRSKSYEDYIAESLLARYSCADDFDSPTKLKFRIR